MLGILATTNTLIIRRSGGDDENKYCDVNSSSLRRGSAVVTSRDGSGLNYFYVR
jgi:hypothetical protein